MPSVENECEIRSFTVGDLKRKHEYTMRNTLPSSLFATRWNRSEQLCANVTRFSRGEQADSGRGRSPEPLSVSPWSDARVIMRRLRYTSAASPRVCGFSAKTEHQPT